MFLFHSHFENYIKMVCNLSSYILIHYVRQCVRQWTSVNKTQMYGWSSFSANPPTVAVCLDFSGLFSQRFWIEKHEKRTQSFLRRCFCCHCYVFAVPRGALHRREEVGEQMCVCVCVFFLPLSLFAEILQSDNDMVLRSHKCILFLI